MAKLCVKTLPHSSREFETADELREWIGTGLKGRGGEYLAPSIRSRKGILPGCICLFKRDNKIVGEAIVKEAVKPYGGSEVSPVTKEKYEGVLTFEPSSIRRYVNPIDSDKIKKITGKGLSAQFSQNIEWDDYGKLLAEVAKGGFY